MADSIEQDSSQREEEAKKPEDIGDIASNGAESKFTSIATESAEVGTALKSKGSNQDEDEELEEGELKDDDDDDDDDDDVGDDNKKGDVVDGLTRASRTQFDESDAENRKRGSSSESRKSSGKDSTKSSVKSSLRSSGNGAQRIKAEALSTRSSSSSIDRIPRPLSFSSRQGSTSRHSSRSHSHSKRRLSPINDSSQSRLVTMRAQLLEAKSREIEMKFQKNKIHVPSSSSPLSTFTLATPVKNLKTTSTKPQITYAENPNPIDLNGEPKKKAKSSKSSKRESKERSKSTKKSSKKRKKKSSSSSKKKKRAKTSDTPRKSDTNEKINPTSAQAAEANADRVGPKTPPDNQVLTLDDEQVEWPSYLIKMTTTLPSISYSVNPDSVAENNIAGRVDTSDLNADYLWYYNYFVDTFDMDKVQAQNQAYSILVSAGNYDRSLLDRWLERQGFTNQLDAVSDRGAQKDLIVDSNDAAQIPLRISQPLVTTLKSHREVVLPNGKILPRGTVQKIVHPYPKTGRVTPDLVYSNFNLY